MSACPLLSTVFDAVAQELLLMLQQAQSGATATRQQGASKGSSSKQPQDWKTQLLDVDRTTLYACGAVLGACTAAVVLLGLRAQMGW